MEEFTLVAVAFGVEFFWKLAREPVRGSPVPVW